MLDVEAVSSILSPLNLDEVLASVMSESDMSRSSGTPCDTLYVSLGPPFATNHAWLTSWVLSELVLRHFPLPDTALGVHQVIDPS